MGCYNVENSVYLEVEKERGDTESTMKIMQTDQKWIVVRIDGKIAAISTDYKALAKISSHLASAGTSPKAATSRTTTYREVSAKTVGTEEIMKIRKETTWDELMLFGTDFQKKVWKKLWGLTHQQGEEAAPPQLFSYSDFAELCDNKAGVRAVAHAIGLNPIPVVIPCHLVVPKESIDRMREIQRKAEATIFKGEDLCLSSILADTTIDFGEYSLGKSLKRDLISLDLA